VSKFLFQDIDLEGWAIETLKNSTEFNVFVENILGKSLNYYSSIPLDENMQEETLPSLATYFTDEIADKTDEYVQTWILPLAIRIEPNLEPDLTNGIKRWKSMKNLKSIAIKAIQILQEDVEQCGINGNGNINIIDGELVMSEIGEATEDIQASISLAFRKLNQI
jgi:hypothetical protein